MTKGLPKQWVIAPLESLCDKFRGVSYKREDASPTPKKGYLPVLRANNINGDKLNFEDLVWVPASRIQNQQMIRKGDIVIAMSSGSKSVVGKTAQALQDWEGGFGAFCGVLRPFSSINSRYLGMFLRTREYRSIISELAAGSNINNLKNEHLANIEIPVAPPDEQQRIVAKLERTLEKVDNCQKRLAKIPPLLKRFRQSVLAAACSGRLTADWRKAGPGSDMCEIPDKWRECSVGEVIENLKYGTSQKCDVVKNGVPVLRIPNVANGSINLEDLKYAELPEKEFNQLRLREGDILLIRSNGSVSLVGKCALVHKREVDYAYAGYLIRIRPNAAIIVPAFLDLILGSYDIRLQIEQEARSTSGVNNINSDEVRSLRILVPPLSEQMEIVKRIQKLFELADQIEARFKNATVHTGKLTQSILAKAFRGELVPQEPNDGSAAILVQRHSVEK